MRYETWKELDVSARAYNPDTGELKAEDQEVKVIVPYVTS